MLQKPRSSNLHRHRKMPAGGAEVQMRLAAQVQTLRSASTHKSRLASDEERWQEAEMAFGQAVQSLPSMVHQAPKYSDGIHSVLGELRGILDTGKEMVKRNRQLLNQEESALKDLEKSFFD